MMRKLFSAALALIALAPFLFGGLAYAQVNTTPSPATPSICYRVSATQCTLVDATHPLPTHDASGGGGGGGAVYGPTPQGSSSANPPVQIGGTADGTATGTVETVKVTSDGLAHVSVDAGTLTFAGSAPVAGITASGASLTENPLANGGRAATTWPTAVTDGQKVAAMMDVGGRQVVKPFAPSALDWRGTNSTTGSGATTVSNSSNASFKTYVTGIQAYNTSAVTVTVALNDTASTVLIVPPGGGTNVVFPTPLVLSVINTSLTFTPSGGETTVGLNAQGYFAP